MEDDATKVTLPYPAHTRQAAAEINGVKTDVVAISFADRIMITITQGGRLAQWVTVPLHNENPTSGDPYFMTTTAAGRSEDEDQDDVLLPTTRFQARTLLGAGSAEREMMGQLYACQIASMITAKNPEETRTLMLGLGLAKVDTERDTFLEIVNLVVEIL